jgi:hypothetical protein
MKKLLFFLLILLISLPLFGQVKQYQIQRDSTLWIDSTLVALKDSLSDHGDRININVDSLNVHTGDINSLKAFDSAQTDTNTSQRNDIGLKLNLAGGTLSGDLIISKVNPRLTFDNSTGVDAVLLTSNSIFSVGDAGNLNILQVDLFDDVVNVYDDLNIGGNVLTGTWQASIIGDAYLTKTGNWTGTFDGEEGSYYLDLANSTGTTDDITEGSTNFYYTETKFDTSFNQALRLRDTISITNAYQASNGVYNDTWGNPKGGYKFDGTNDYVSVPDNDNLDFGTGDFSVEVYFNASSSGSGFDVLVNKYSTSGFFIGLNSFGYIYMELKDGVTTLTPTIGTTNLRDNKYHHLIAVFDRDASVTVYIDGLVLGSSVISTCSGSLSNSTDMRFGTNSGSLSNPFQGDIKFARLYNRALIANEVTTLYGNGLGSELDFEDVGASQTDLLDGWDFTSGWIITNAVIDNANTFTTSGDGYIRIGTVIDPLFKYELRITGNTDASNFRVRDYNQFDTYFTTTESSFDTTIKINAQNFGLTFRASSASTTVITNLELRKVGCIAEYKGQDMGRLGAIETQNGLHGSTSGSPISLSAEQRPLIYRDVKLSVANTATTLTDIAPYGYQIKAIRALGSNSLTGVKVGTSSGGEQIVASTTVNTTASVLTLAGNIYDETSSTTLYAEHATAAETLDLIFLFEKLGN